MAYKGKKIADGGESQTVWLKVKKSTYKGKDYENFQGSLDLGGGKMLKIQIYADLPTTEKDGETLLAARVSKWKSDRAEKRKTRSW